MIYQRYPNQEINILGEEYPISAQRALMVKLLTYVQYGGIGVLLFGDRIFGYFGMAYPQWYLTIRESKMMYGGIIWMVGNMIIGQFHSTGAFEIYMNGDLIYSKLATGQMPDAGILFNAIDSMN